MIKLFYLLEIYKIIIPLKLTRLHAAEESCCLEGRWFAVAVVLLLRGGWSLSRCRCVERLLWMALSRSMEEIVSPWCQSGVARAMLRWRRVGGFIWQTSKSGVTRAALRRRAESRWYRAALLRRGGSGKDWHRAALRPRCDPVKDWDAWTHSLFILISKHSTLFREDLLFPPLWENEQRLESHPL